MNTKNNIRQRRLERIRELQEGADRRVPSMAAFPPKPSPQDEYRLQDQRPEELRGTPLGEENQWNDPEYVWKRKWQQDLGRQDYEYDDYRSGGSRAAPPKGGLRWKLVASCVLFALIWGLFQWNDPLANKGKAWVSSALNESFQFQSVALWYERQFGGPPSLLPALNSIKQEEAQKVDAVSKHYFSPVQGKIIAPYETSHLGITVETKPDTPVAAMDTGLVVYVGNKEDTGYTIIIRHTNGMQSVYGWVEQGRVALNDWIKGGETIGTVSKNSSKQTGYFYFAVSKDNKFVNPADVVNFD
ncbi:M23 family metallopeptidase [Paenibacillus doosanensis]|uniref:M23 family metallopeptidase n=1 Tax=Paenibacillus doosanensis TaxID=1229154 RepID=UPI00217F6535|nr:M23 family metallopeptidase [Paenibacillus doosanensis]MCS7458720.1 M23 family metallopeptidase [Paenibacillus doosanensis]